MILSNLAAGERVFVDANVLTYHFQPHAVLGPPCRAFLQRIRNGDIEGYTSVHVLAEVAHRMMTFEAIARLQWPPAGIGNRLRKHPAEVQRLQSFRQAIEEVVRGNMHILTLPPSVLVSAMALCQQIGLLTNDGLIVAVMQAHGLSNLASNDADFDRVPGLTRYAPA